jgi:BMFP domain-containing protein YqiC
MEMSASFSTVQKVLDLTEGECSIDQLDKLLDEFRGRMADELYARECFLLTLSEAHRYKEPRKGWGTAIARFPDTATDIEEASKCLAVSRFTAAVFHSLLVVEAGVIELGTFIGVNDPLSNWAAITKKLKKILDADYKTLTPFEQQYRPFFEQIHGTIEALKNAWRNKVSHALGKLTVMTGEEFHPDVAEEILIATRAFMRRLADGLPPRVP